MKPLYWAIPAALVVALTGAALAHSGSPRGPIDPERAMEHVDRALDQVDATEAQRASVRGILQQAMPQLQAYRAEAEAMRGDMRAIFSTPTVDRDALEDARTDLLDLVDRASATGFDTLADVADVLTVQQRAELRALRDERQRRFRSRLGWGTDAG